MNDPAPFANVPAVPLKFESDCRLSLEQNERALQDALITPLDIVPEKTKRNLAPIIGKYVVGEPTGS